MTSDSKATFEKYNCCVIIPTFNNSKTLKNVIESVLEYTNSILVALRNGFKEAVSLGFDRAITIDSDGQHFASDIPIFFKKLEDNPDALIVGARNMSGESIPGKSSIGHKISNFWFHFETGINLPDTQSGFRLYPVKQLDKLKFFTTKYEFEIEVLVKASWSGIAVESVPIRVYYAKGKERVTHFRPLTDFTRVGLLHFWLVILTALWFFPQRFFNRIKKKTSGKIYTTPFSIRMRNLR